MSKYRWIPNAFACSTCQAMATKPFELVPIRPHKNCQCAYVRLNGSREGVRNRTPIILSVTGTSTYVEHHGKEQWMSWNELEAQGREAYKGRAEFGFDVEILCQNNQSVILNVMVIVEDGEMYDTLDKFWGADNHHVPEQPSDDPFIQEIEEAIEDYSGGLEFKARKMAMDIINSGNGPCK